MTIEEIVFNITIYILLVVPPILLLTLIRQRIVEGNPEAKSIFCRWGLHELENETRKLCKHAAVQNFLDFLDKPDYNEEDQDLVRN